MHNCADYNRVMSEWPGIVGNIENSDLLKSSWVKDWSRVDGQVIGTVDDLSTLLRLLTLTGLIGPFSSLQGTLFAVHVTELAAYLHACVQAFNSCSRLAATLKSCFTQTYQFNSLIIPIFHCATANIRYIIIYTCNFGSLQTHLAVSI